MIHVDDDKTEVVVLLGACLGYCQGVWTGMVVLGCARDLENEVRKRGGSVYTQGVWIVTVEVCQQT